MKKRRYRPNAICLHLNEQAREAIRLLPPETNITAYINAAILTYSASMFTEQIKETK